MVLDVERARVELEELKAQAAGFQAPYPPGFELWRNKLTTYIGEIVGPKDAMATRLANLSWISRSMSSRPTMGPGTMWGPDDMRVFAAAKNAATDIIDTLLWHLDRRQAASAPFAEATIDPDLWEHVQGLVDVGDWEKVAREAAVFVEHKLRVWAAVPSSVTGSVNVFKAAIGAGGFQLAKVTPSEQQGWQQLATGFALALRNVSGHRVSDRDDAARYSLGVLGLASLLLTQVRHEYGDPPSIVPKAAPRRP
jgi:Protein of unknown function (Hypoth_ymh)